MVILEIRQQLEHNDALFLEVGLNTSELNLEVGTQYGLFIHWFQQFTVQLGIREDILESLKHVVKVQKTLICDIREVPVMQKTHFFKILRGSYTFL